MGAGLTLAPTVSPRERCMVQFTKWRTLRPLSNTTWLRPRWIACVLVTASFFSGCGGSTAPSNPNVQLPSLQFEVDNAVNAYMTAYGVPGVTVAVAQNGKILYAHGYGYDGDNRATKPADIFEIGSITKQFTAALIMKLQEQGKLNVDDSITKYLPQYGFPSAITLRMLLTHTSGLANYTSFSQMAGWAANGVSVDTVLTAIGQAPLQFTPGALYEYSNSNYFALGAIIEAVTGKSYEANLDQYIIQPLGLQNTYYQLPPAALAATGYSGSVPVIPWTRSSAFAAGALSTNVYDLVTWENALMTGKVVLEASFQEMTTSNGFITNILPYVNGGSYGFGLVLGTTNGHAIMTHNGGVPGFITDELVFLDSGVTVVELTDSSSVNLTRGFSPLVGSACSSAELHSVCGAT